MRLREQPRRCLRVGLGRVGFDLFTRLNPSPLVTAFLSRSAPAEETQRDQISGSGARVVVSVPES